MNKEANFKTKPIIAADPSSALSKHTPGISSRFRMHEDYRVQGPGSWGPRIVAASSHCAKCIKYDTVVTR
jgi:hypothetical protein